MKMVTAYSALLLEVVFTYLESAVLVKSVCPPVSFDVFFPFFAALRWNQNRRQEVIFIRSRIF